MSRYSNESDRGYATIEQDPIHSVRVLAENVVEFDVLSRTVEMDTDEQEEDILAEIQDQLNECFGAEVDGHDDDDDDEDRDVPPNLVAAYGEGNFDYGEREQKKGFGGSIVVEITDQTYDYFTVRLWSDDQDATEMLWALTQIDWPNLSTYDYKRIAKRHDLKFIDEGKTTSAPVIYVDEGDFRCISICEPHMYDLGEGKKTSGPARLGLKFRVENPIKNLEYARDLTHAINSKLLENGRSPVAKIVPCYVMEEEEAAGLKEVEGKEIECFYVDNMSVKDALDLLCGHGYLSQKTAMKAYQVYELQPSKLMPLHRAGKDAGIISYN